MRASAAAIACIVTAACASTQSTTSGIPAMQVGSYFVVARADGVALRGRMAVFRDSVALELERTECRRDFRDVTNMAAAYECNPVNNLTDIRVFIARNDPVHSSYWRARTSRTAYERTCMAMTIVNAKEVCNRYETVPKETLVPVNGDLVATRNPGK